MSERANSRIRRPAARDWVPGCRVTAPCPPTLLDSASHRPAWHLVRTYPEAWLAPYLGAHLSCTCLTPSLGLSYPWLTPDLDVAGT